MKPSENVAQDNFNFPKACLEMKTELKFPSCWDGKNLWKDDMSHMAYAEKVLYGRKCHPLGSLPIHVNIIR